MIFHTFGDESNKTAVLIHGALTPWQIWDTAVEKFKEDYFVVVPELDAHTQEEASSFRSVEDEAEKIAEFLRQTRGGKTDLLAGLSMGGHIAAELAGRQDIKVNNLVLDGAPLMPLPKIFVSVMTRNYLSIIHKSQRRDPRVIESFKRDFLPEKYLGDFLKIADNMEENSVKNMLESVFGRFEFRKIDGQILFMHGTKGNESVAAKSARKMKAVNPQTDIKVYKGYAHAQLLCFEPSKWASETSAWLEGREDADRS